MQSSHPLRGSVADLAPHLRNALGILLEARAYAQTFQLDVWDFAVELATLQTAGLTSSDLRWLICLGYGEHAEETPAPRKDHRAFRRVGQLCFTQQTCFVLTDRGVGAARLPGHPELTVGLGQREDLSVNGKGNLPSERPCWDAGLRELRVGEAVVKRFKVPAPNQELILASFEEEGWPLHIDDPLPPKPDLDPRRRLHDTINHLNRNQKQRLIQFLGNGDGRGIHWQALG
jgi:hypothetical protein